MKGRKRIWMLLYRYEEGHKVWLYEPLRKYELNARKRQGWRVWGNAQHQLFARITNKNRESSRD